MPSLLSYFFGETPIKNFLHTRALGQVETLAAEDMDLACPR